ncbi:MAG: DNA mismatch repair endonuclease MutL [Anaerovorax sp.]|nr:DNA mismatch repair endonuclease MutL [Anaerovorax sp.]
MKSVERRKIQALSKDVADKIAAGEVVDRPISIVKELLENAIDAGADSIVVEIKNGGKTYIRITDNGCGIPKNEVELAFQRHATSKIKEAADLNHIHTLGFRGEALSSICAVSRTELITKTPEEKTGIRLCIDGGQVVHKTDTGCPDGTTIIVTDLFYNTPARLKFLKADHTESTLIIDFISKMALAYPDIKIRLINNGSILFSTPGKGDIYTNILTIYSKEIGQKLIHLTEDDEKGIKLEAYVSSPDQTKTNRKSQIFFVNGRYISSKILDKAVSEAYAEKLFEGRYPIAFLFLSIDPEQLDVNIHPNKQEIRFDDEGNVSHFVRTCIRKGLLTADAIPEVKKENLFAKMPVNIKNKKTEEQVDIKKLLETKRKEQEIITESQNSPFINKTNEKAKDITKNIENDLSVVKESCETYSLPIQQPVEQQNGITAFDLSSLRPTGSLFGTYITAVDENYFYLIDQHAAHERVFYETLLEQYHLEEKPSQILLTPYLIEIPYRLKNDDVHWIHCLKQIGFALEEFGQRSYRVTEIPMYMSLTESERFLDYFCDNLTEDEELSDPKKWDDIVMKACKSAIKANDSLDLQEMIQLLKDLSNTKNPFSCPHGRPTFIKMSKYEIEKMFKRT